MATTAAAEIGSPIEIDPDIRAGRPCLAGTGVSVHRVVSWYQIGLTPEEIAERIGHLSPAQVHAALTYYHANQRQIDDDIAADDAEAEALERQHLATRPIGDAPPLLRRGLEKHAVAGE
jgi:uncharacterized protein (DUF433 family)